MFRRRRKSIFSSSSSRRRGPVWIEAGARRRRRGPGPPIVRVLLAIMVLAAAAAAVVSLVRSRDHAADQRRAVALSFVAAWQRGDTGAMWRLADPATRRRYTPARFATAYKQASRAAGVQRLTVGRPRALQHGRVRVAVVAHTRDFGTLRGVVSLPVAGDGSTPPRVTWSSALRLPGLRDGEAVRRHVGAQPERAAVLAAGGRRLDGSATGAVIAGSPPADGTPGSGLEARYDRQLAGRPAEELRFGDRVVARAAARRPRSVQTSIRPRLSAVAAQALGGKVGGVAVIRPRDGAVLALAGLAVSAPQPPGSTFKIVTLSAALSAGIASPSSTYPVRTFATLSGVKLRNANDESCGGQLAVAFAESCNSVFAPLGARLGAKRLVAMAEAFGFNETPAIPAAKASTIPAAGKLRDSLAVGASAIGQDRDLATPLQMASVGATIGARGVRARPRIVTTEPVVRRRVVSRRVATQVREMMLGVVRAGTGTAASIPGVEVAGKTGTAELRSTVGGPSDPKNTDAWFVAFAPARHPTIAVGVMLVGAGAGGKAAAPIAQRVLRAALP